MSSTYPLRSGEVPTSTQLSRPGIKDYAASTTTAGSPLSSETVILTKTNFTFEANRAYRIEFHAFFRDAGTDPTRIHIRLRKTNAAGALWIDFGQQRIFAGTVVAGATGMGFLRRHTGTDLVTTAVLTAQTDGQAEMFGSSTNRNFFTIEDVGASTDFAIIAFNIT